jgi:hypothetical protein
MKRWLPLLLILCLVAPAAWAQDDDDASPLTPPSLAEAPRSNFLQFSSTNTPWVDPALDPLTTDVISTGWTNWSSFHGRVLQGHHQFDLNGGLSGFNEIAVPGEAMQAGVFMSSVTYRYTGILGGVIRPVARFSAGGGQDWGPVGGRGFSGYGAYGTAWVAPEMGIEIVYKGIGIGVTESYVWRQNFDTMVGNEDVVGPGILNPQPDLTNWSEWLTNFYLIVE